MSHVNGQNLSNLVPPGDENPILVDRNCRDRFEINNLTSTRATLIVATEIGDYTVLVSPETGDRKRTLGRMCPQRRGPAVKRTRPLAVEANWLRRLRGTDGPKPNL